MSEEKIVKNNSKPSELTNEQVSNVSGGVVLDMRGHNETSKPYLTLDDEDTRIVIGKHKTKLGARLDALKHGKSPVVYTPEEIITNSCKYSVMLRTMIKNMQEES